MTQAREQLKQFRQSLYTLFNQRQDALFNLIDANTSFGHRCRSIVELSCAPCFHRKYSSITDAIADGACQVDWSRVSQLIQDSHQTPQQPTMRKFIIDCTPNPRPFAKTLAERVVTHAPNPAPGNKPIAVGHQYSALVELPCDTLSHKKHWVVPMHVQRVKQAEKGNEVGLQQLIDHLKQNKLTDELVLSIGDSLYGTEACRTIAGQQDNLIHLFRLNSQRNIFLPPDNDDTTASVGRKKVFGQKLSLSKLDAFPNSDQPATTTWVSAKGQHYQVQIECWNDVLLRGSRKFRSEKHPINLLKITVTDEQGQQLFKRPLMLGVSGRRRSELSLIDAFNSYHDRYDIEHFFRFGKQKLLMDAYQTPSVEHEEAWWWICLISYHQLYLARLLTQATPRPWEKYLPAYQQAQEGTVTPTQAQRGFANLLETIGSPAKLCVPRGRLSGRVLGSTQEKRPQQDILFKAKKAAKKPLANDLDRIISMLEKSAKNSSIEKIDDLVGLVKKLLNTTHFNIEQLIEMLNNSS